DIGVRRVAAAFFLRKLRADFRQGLAPTGWRRFHFSQGLNGHRMFLCRRYGSGGTGAGRGGAELSENCGRSTMTKTPDSFADRPERPGQPAAPDALSELLRAVRLTGAGFFRGSFPAPFGCRSPERS